MRVPRLALLILLAALSIVPLLTSSGVAAGQPATPTFADSFEVTVLVA